MEPITTNRGVYLDIYTSPLYYDFENLRFYFSSQFYVNSFTDKLYNYILEEQLKFESRYLCKISQKGFFAIRLYKRIEKRGFRVEIKENNKYVDLKTYLLQIDF